MWGRSTLTSIRGVYDHLFRGWSCAHVIEGPDNDEVRGGLLQPLQHELLAFLASVRLQRPEGEGSLHVHLFVANVVALQRYPPFVAGGTLRGRKKIVMRLQENQTDTRMKINKLHLKIYFMN